MHHWRASLRAVWMFAALPLAACGEQNQYVPPPPPKVTVAPPVQQPVARYLEATGNTAAVNMADLVARVPGFLQSVNYRDGQAVKKGDLLFVIEPEPYKVKVEQAKAAEAGSEANFKQAETAFQRQADLLSRQTASQATYDQALATRDAARATLDQAKSNTALAELNHDYTQVIAPFDGIVTARQVSIGQYVGGTATPTVLATIVQHNPIWVNFNVSEKDVLEVRATLARQGLRVEDLKNIPVEVGLQSDAAYPHHGTLDYVSPTVNQSTGTLASRAVLENRDGLLLPGYFVRVRIPRGQPRPSLLVPEVALGSDLSGRYLLIVNKDNMVEQRPVEIGPQAGSLRVVEKGITADDRVIVSGLLRAIPGQKVEPQMQSTPAPGATR